MKPEDRQRDAIVVGAGMVGVCSAWHLQKRGFRVTVVDRKAPGEETSWGNGGLIQRECVLPYSFPSGYRERMEIAFGLRDSTRCKPAALVKYWYAIFDYWRCSLPRNYDTIARQFATLIEHCISEHEVLIKASGSENLVRKGGFLEMFRSKTVDEIEKLAENMRARGVHVNVLSPPEIKKAEPFVDTTHFSGAVDFVDAWRATNPGALVKSYADHFVSKGGTVVQATVQKVTPPSKDGDRWIVHTDAGDLSAANVVIAAGPWSGTLMESLGYWFPLYPLRGYSAHFDTVGEATLNTTVVDIESGFTIGPMEQGMRITTGGELNLMTNPPTEDIMKASETVARTWFPLGKQITKTWFGHRPCMSDMRPVIGESRCQPGLWMNFGHGHSGFTLGPASGRLLAELMNSEKPLVDPSPFDPNRFTWSPSA